MFAWGSDSMSDPFFRCNRGKARRSFDCSPGRSFLCHVCSWLFSLIMYIMSTYKCTAVRLVRPSVRRAKPPSHFHNIKAWAIHRLNLSHRNDRSTISHKRPVNNGGQNTFRWSLPDRKPYVRSQYFFARRLFQLALRPWFPRTKSVFWAQIVTTSIFIYLIVIII